jgi:hypothetical protein
MQFLMRPLFCPDLPAAFRAAVIALAAVADCNAAEQQPPPQAPVTSLQSNVTESDYASCIAVLRSDNVEFEPLGSVTVKGCTVTGAIRLQEIETAFGQVSMPRRPMMLCSFARQFTGWVRDVGAPLAVAYTGQKLVAIETGPGLVCRNRYNNPNEKISEHAKGNAIDIASFLLADKSRIEVKELPTTTPAARNLIHALRMTGCGYFTTVLGPGSNSAHEEHLHFDYGLHGKSANYRICE